MTGRWRWRSFLAVGQPSGVGVESVVAEELEYKLCDFNSSITRSLLIIGPLFVSRYILHSNRPVQIGLIISNWPVNSVYFFLKLLCRFSLSSCSRLSLNCHFNMYFTQCISPAPHPAVGLEKLALAL